MSSLSDTLEKLKKLDDERNKLIEATKAGILSAIQDHLAALAGLGFDYQLVARGARARRRASAESKPSGRVCSVCGQSGHNSRTCPKNPKNK
jgi:uncharacterized protein (UPF0335 family)